MVVFRQCRPQNSGATPIRFIKHILVFLRLRVSYYLASRIGACRGARRASVDVYEGVAGSKSYLPDGCADIILSCHRKPSDWTLLPIYIFFLSGDRRNKSQAAFVRQNVINPDIHSCNWLDPNGQAGALESLARGVYSESEYCIE